MFMPLSIAAIGDRVLRVNNVSRRLALPERTVRWLAVTGKLPGFKNGPKIWLFHERDVERFRQERQLRGAA
jgi:hypothetical protein